MNVEDNVKMEDKNKEPEPQWKGSVIFGIINILLVLLCTKLNIILISGVMILLILCGFVLSLQGIKENWKAGFKLSALGCVAGLLLQCLAGTLYVINILMGFVVMFNH